MSSKIISELIYRLIADETELVKGFKAAEKKNDELAKKFTETGKKLTLGLTVPIVAAGAAMVKLASDTVESLNASNVVFKKSGGVIEAWGKSAATQAGLTAAEFYQSSAVIGAGLINAGMSADKAAEQTINLTKRAADMASIFNTSVADAMTALQAGLRGESEPLRRFAVSLTEADVQARALALGMVDGEGKATTYGKSQARLALIMEQSAKFQGDFTNTSNQLANSTRITTAMVKEAAAELGTQLLPIVLEVVSGIRGLVEKFSEMSDGQKKAILITAAMAAAIGPLLIGIGNTVRAVSTLKLALIGLNLAGGPITLIVAGVIALGVGLAKVASDIKAVDDALKQARNFDATRTVAENEKILAAFKSDVAYAYKRAKEASGISDATRKNLYDSADALAAQYRTFEGQVKLQKENADLQAKAAATAATKAEAERISLEKQAALEAKKAALRQEALAFIDETITASQSEEQILQDQITALLTLTGLSKEEDARRLQAIDILMQKQADAIRKQYLAEGEAAQEEYDTAWEFTQARIALTNEQYDAEVEANKVAQEKIKETRKATADFAYGQIKELTRLISSSELEAIDSKAKKEKEAINNSLKNESLKASEIKRIDQEMAIAKAKIARKQAVFAKAQSLIEIGFNTAKAITSALTLVPPFGQIAAVVVGGLAAAQAAAVLASPLPEIPSFAQGGSFMVPAGFPNDSYPIPAAMVQSGERVTVETPAQQSVANGVHLHIGTLIADPAGFRELNRQLAKYNSVEIARRG